MDKLTGLMGLAAQLIEAVENALPERWRGRKAMIMGAAFVLLLTTGLGDSWKGITTVLGAASLFVAPEGVRDIVAAAKTKPRPKRNA